LFALATTPSGDVPANTLEAISNIARNPWKNPALLYVQSKLQATYQPTLQSPPSAWTLALVYEGNGHEFDGPGEMSVDTQGNIWITNNYVYSRDPRTCVSGGRQLLRLTPTGMDAPGAPYSGGGLFGAGFGITIDPMGKVWVGNFGFQGADNGVDCDPNPPPLSASEFSPTGTALSPSTGYTTDISQPQGMASDPQGNIWIANCGSNSVTKYPGGDATQPANFADIGLLRPFGLAVDAQGNAWIASSGNHSLVALDPQGKPLLDSAVDVGAQDPLGVAVDAEGNVWVANSGVVSLPCGGSKGGISPPSAIPRITEVRRSGSSATATTFTGGGLLVPWSIAVDGDDHVWVANFAGKRLSEFCGTKPETCPRGLTTGDAISPRTGYGFDGLTRNTGVVIDPSGNVWLANNWKTIAVQTNPGGDGMVEFIGLAAPIQTPLIGPPHRP
jgi:sugar lactone lactonase YvrE